MKLAAFCLTCFLSTASAGTLYSQSARISLDMRNASVEQVLQEIEESSEFYFMYNSKLVNVDRKVNIKVKDKSIETILNKICKAANIEYSVNDKQIILRPKSMEANATQQKTKTIKGIVNDQLGPITGANVSVNGTTIGTITDHGWSFHFGGSGKCDTTSIFYRLPDSKCKSGGTNRFYNLHERRYTKIG